MKNLKNKKRLNIDNVVLDNNQISLEMEKFASDNIIMQKSSKETYPITTLEEDFEVIKETYKLLSKNVKQKILIHPAGEWILDNFYIIEETTKTIAKELTVKKYTNFLGLANGPYEGYARIYVLASKIVSYTDGKIDYDNLEKMLTAYQKKKTLNMDEIWNIGLFLQICLIQKIRQICESIYITQIQKSKAEIILSHIFNKQTKPDYKMTSELRKKIKQNNQMKYAFIEYMSYKLKKYGRKANSYLNALEEVVNRSGGEISEIIKKEHFEVAVKKVSMGNCITSIKNISRINFAGIFENINGVEEILKKDPINQYEIMDLTTKIYYRNTIQEIAKKTKISEIYIAKKCLELSENATEERKRHIGYYLLEEGRKELYKCLGVNKTELKYTTKANLYIYGVWLASILICIAVSMASYLSLKNMLAAIIIFILTIIPVEGIISKIVQNILGNIVKPKLLPKLNFQNGVPKEFATMVVIPTIVDSSKKVQEIFEKLEVYYIANKSPNIYFTFLGDCTSSQSEIEKFDDNIIKDGIDNVNRLNEKYGGNIFNFVYRKRIWNASEGCFMGWERKRGMLNQFNEYLLGNIKNQFRVNTLENQKQLEIKYIITLDSDTELTLNSGIELIGAMAHILNRPILNEEENLVVKGHGIIAPQVGIGIEESKKSAFTNLFAGDGGTDSYTSAVSDFYEDNFDEGIFTGKGIYDLQTFSTVLNNKIKENTVLSHDLLEGSYLRCGLASDIFLIDGFPSNYLSFRTRLERWLRGDFQITQWLSGKIQNGKGYTEKNSLNKLSKYKILSNIVRSKQESFCVGLIFLFLVLGIIFNKRMYVLPIIVLLFIMIDFILEGINKIIKNDAGNVTTKRFVKTINGVGATFIRSLLNFATLLDKSCVSLKAGILTFYRMNFSKKHLLQWTTSEEAEKKTKQTLKSYYKEMLCSTVIAIVLLALSFFITDNICKAVLIICAINWALAPLIMFEVSKKNIRKRKIEELNNEQINYVLDVGKRTWLYFKDNINESTNFLPPDNYQEDRKQKLVDRTSSTNIGLALLAVVSSYDLGYETLQDTIDLLYKMCETIGKLQKWNGHLYNWYNIKTLEPLIPKYVSAVDSGNFVGYLYTLKQFLEEIKEKDLRINSMILLIQNIIDNTNFKVLYNEKIRLFSVGYNIEDDKITDSYYDLLASEARQTSFIAIAKKDISEKHWYNLSRTLTTLNNYKGLVSWSGTAFEYLMPTVNIPNYQGSILDESCKFMIMSQIEYAKKLGIPWGISEAAFNLKDLNNNYQYKAFGIPWLGLKRGLQQEVVVAPYGSILAINELPDEVIENMKQLEKLGMYDKYGFYESIDFTPERVTNKKDYSQVKTFMAHHQGLILLSINNLINDQIFQKRFMKNPEMQAISILLEERMPQNMIITKEEKEKIEKIKYIDYEDYAERRYSKINDKINISNVISNDKYTVVIDQYGNGYSKFGNIQVNRFKPTEEIDQGIKFYIKNTRNKNIWTNTMSKFEKRPEKYNMIFAPETDKFIKNYENIETTTKIVLDTDEPVEIRRLELKNTGKNEETLEVTSSIEPVISDKFQDYSHRAFNNLFLRYEYIEELNCILVQRKSREDNSKSTFLAVMLQGGENKAEFEIDREKFEGRNNFAFPQMVQNSTLLSSEIGYVTEPIIAMRKTLVIEPGKTKKLNLIISVGTNREDTLKNIVKYINEENINRTFDFARAKSEAENRYLGIKGKNLIAYQKLLTHLIFLPKTKIKNTPVSYKLEDLWKFGISGDNPILLVKIKEISDIDFILEVLKAYEYFRLKNIRVDLVILNSEKESYENAVRTALMNSVLNNNLEYLLNTEIFIINNFEAKDEKILDEKANVILNANFNNLNSQIEEIENNLQENFKERNLDLINKNYEAIIDEKIETYESENLKYYNGYGGFSEDGKEYFIKVNKIQKTPLAWSNILANENFGTLTTESMGGYTWYKNSRLNRLTAWENNSVTDLPTEVIYLKDMESGKRWSLGAVPLPDENNYYVTYGLGYSKYKHTSSKIKQEVKVFVPQKDNIKINLISLENQNPQKKILKLIYYVKPVLGEDEIKTSKEITIKCKSNMVIAKNLSKDLESSMFISSSEKINSYTGSKNSFFKGGGLGNPSALDEINLSYEDSFSQDSIIAVEMEVELEAFSKKEISLLLGTAETIEDMQEISYKYSNINNCKSEYMKNKRFWEDFVNVLQVKTPEESTNIMLNGWLIYQSLASRMYGRTGLYQSGGAYGFRDQLQDTLSLKYIDASIQRKQILKHAKSQFEEGDVEHWWHEETSRGIRTRMTDDLLWLVFVTCDYISFTNDYKILDEVIPYKTGKVLEEGELERYDLYKESALKESLYKHCKRAIKKAMNFGENGLPKIGTGDWNDGMSNVGPMGKGESVWLGFFIYDVLNKFIPILNYKEDFEEAKEYKKIAEELRKALNTVAWDGRWYKRAFTDDGKTLGSLQNEECRIDNISQSWSVISGSGENDKKYIAMESLENHLVDEEIGIIKLLDPPFDKSKIEPGYIKSYLPGTRENGGQYTHAATWAIIAEAILGLNDKAYKNFRMINPIEHSKTKVEANIYKVEPYVIAADIYGKQNLAGRGGWTWYTGASSWYYVAGIKYLLGLNIQNGYLEIKPHIPSWWKEYEIKYKLEKNIYNIKVTNRSQSSTECLQNVEKVTCNGEKVEEQRIKIVPNTGVYNIEVEI